MVFYHSNKIYLLQHLKYKDGAIDIWKHVYSSSKKRLEEAADVSTLREKNMTIKMRCNSNLYPHMFQNN